MRRLGTLAVLGTLASTCLTTAGAAQAATSPAAQVPHTQIISTSPLGLVFGLLSVDYERRLSAVTTLGASGSYFAPDGGSYVSADARYRYYPQEQALEKFSFGGTAGFTRFAAADDFCDPEFESCGSDDAGNALTLGLELGYAWLLGRQERFAVGVGVGAKRLFFLNDDVDTEDVLETLPTVRLSIGYAF